jgi:hypothetical protein
MKITAIFAIQEFTLYSVAYDNNEMEFKRLFDSWIYDFEYLFRFFEENNIDLNSSFYDNISIEEAVKRTRKQAIVFREKFYRLAENTLLSNVKLQTVFRPLHNAEYHFKELSKEKSKADWLRIYAIRISENTYVISGGAIKLTQTMNERPHLQLELRKLEMTKQFLIENGLTDEADYGFIEFKED